MTAAGEIWVTVDIFTRSGGVWAQQAKLVGTGSVGSAGQGYSLSISADGNTAVIGGYGDNASVGAAWVFARTGSVWTQQGGKLVGTGGVGTQFQGLSVAISADGNTAVVGGASDNSNAGAAWIYSRGGGVWTQEGGKLVGTGAVGSAQQGTSVSMSSDGNIAIVGGYADNGNAGGTWVFTRSGGVWSQQGSKLVGAGSSTPASQGNSVSLSSDATTLLVGGPGDNSGAGAVWVYINSALVSVSDTEQPVALMLDQNYPNPFHRATVIRYTLPTASRATLKIYDVLGHEVSTLLNAEMKPGRYMARWDGAALASGVYFCRLQAGNVIESRKFMLLK